MLCLKNKKSFPDCFWNHYWIIGFSGGFSWQQRFRKSFNTTTCIKYNRSALLCSSYKVIQDTATNAYTIGQFVRKT